MQNVWVDKGKFGIRERKGCYYSDVIIYVQGVIFVYAK